jgi:hypothetical protein
MTVEKLNGLNLVAQVQGKVMEVQQIQTRNGKNLFRNIIRTAAGDEYDYPDTVCVLSDSSVGNMGSVVTLSAKLRGKTNKDQQGRTFYNCELWLHKV